MKTRFLAIPILLLSLFRFSLSAAPGVNTDLSLPAGTAIPVTFRHTLNAARLKVGDSVLAKTDQVIILAGGRKIPPGAELVGTIVNAQPKSSTGAPSELAIKFDSLRTRRQNITVHVALRAIASFVDSYSSRSAVVDNGYESSNVYRQVGGDYFYHDDTVYSNEWDEVGKSTHDGVFVKLEQISNLHNDVVCDATETLQSVGVFASSACGVYGFQDFIVDASGSDNSAVIRIRSTTHTVEIASYSTALFQVTETKQ